jgi:hypothetical protein
MIIVDLDNCISDDGWRIHLIDFSEQDFDKRHEKYHEKCHQDALRNAHLVRETDDILIFTSRPEKYRRLTEEWLAMNKIYYKQLVMRPQGNHDSSVALKEEMLVTSPYFTRIVQAFDDRKDIVEMYINAGIDAAVVQINDNDYQMGVPEILMVAAQTFKERNAQYGDNYKKFGSIMRSLFPDGLNISSEDEWNRIGLFVQLVSKTTRYAANMDKGGHEDSAHDACVYAAMLQEMTK